MTVGSRRVAEVALVTRGRVPRSLGSDQTVLIVATLAVLALVLGGLRMARAPAAAKDKDMTVPPLVTVVVPALGNVASTVSLTGQISAQNDMPIGVLEEKAIAGGRSAELNILDPAGNELCRRFVKE